MTPRIIQAIYDLVKSHNGHGTHNPFLFKTQADAISFCHAVDSLMKNDVYSRRDSNAVSVFHGTPAGIVVAALNKPSARRRKR